MHKGIKRKEPFRKNGRCKFNFLKTHTYTHHWINIFGPLTLICRGKEVVVLEYKRQNPKLKIEFLYVALIAEVCFSLYTPMREAHMVAELQAVNKIID